MGTKRQELEKYLKEQRIVMVSQKVRGNPTPMGNRELDTKTDYWVCTLKYMSRDIHPFTFTIRHSIGRSSFRQVGVRATLTPPTIYDSLAYFKTIISQIEGKSFIEWSKTVRADPYDMRAMIEHFLMVAALDGFKQFLGERYDVVKELIMDIFKYGY